MQLHTAGLLVIQNRKLLLAFSLNKQCYYLPGGKIDTGEIASVALCREIAEELDCELHPAELTFYTHISAPAYGEMSGTVMEQECFLINRSITPKASAEISSLRYFTLSEYLQETNRAPGAVMILEQLKQNGFID